MTNKPCFACVSEIFYCTVPAALWQRPRSYQRLLHAGIERQTSMHILLRLPPPGGQVDFSVSSDDVKLNPKP